MQQLYLWPFSQVLHASAQRDTPESSINANVFNVISIAISTFAVFAGTVSNNIQGSRARNQMNRLGGSALIGAGILTATMTQR